MDNLSAHKVKGIAEAIEARSHTLPKTSLARTVEGGSNTVAMRSGDLSVNVGAPSDAHRPARAGRGGATPP
jgi:hypothetical protein